MLSTAAVIDIGSNSIKLLVTPREDGQLRALTSKTLETRISAGISQKTPALAEDGMKRGLSAIQLLLAEAAPFQPRATILVATSAVRDASNGPDFRERVRRATGHEIRILTGDEEANLIGRGLTCDPALAGLNDFYVFDLGGGSLECLAFRERKIAQAVSLQLGCVRLTEKFVAAPAMAFPETVHSQIRQHVRDVFATSGFRFDLPFSAAAVGTGGTITTARAMLAAREGRTFDQSASTLSVSELKALLAWIAPLPLPERQQIPGLPAGRADILPAALATVLAVAEFGELNAFQNSLYNLRWGLAAEALEPRQS